MSKEIFTLGASLPIATAARLDWDDLLHALTQQPIHWTITNHKTDRSVVMADASLERIVRPAPAHSGIDYRPYWSERDHERMREEIDRRKATDLLTYRFRRVFAQDTCEFSKHFILAEGDRGSLLRIAFGNEWRVLEPATS